MPSRAATINGQKYVSLESWGREHGLHATWIKHGEMALTDKDTRLVFTVNAAESEINGVNVRLSFPIAGANGSALIAQFDLDSAVIPLMRPERFTDHNKITTICLDPGHGGKDTGNRVHSGGWRDEKTYTLLLARDVREALEKDGFKVIMTRDKDVYVGLGARPAIAKKRGADLFISLHFNAATSDKNRVKGIETYCITPVGAASSNAHGKGSNHSPVTGNRYERRSLLFAYQMQKALVQNLHTDDRDVRRARFAVLCDAEMPAILIEGGYMTNPSESKKIFTSSYRRQMASAIVKGILAYKNLSE